MSLDPAAGLLVALLLAPPLAHRLLWPGPRCAGEAAASALPWPQLALIELLGWLVAVLLAAATTLWLGLFTRVFFLLAFFAWFIALAPLLRGCTAHLAVSHVRPPPRTPELLAASAGMALAAVPLLKLSWAALPMAGDALAYHLPMAAQWVQHGSIFASDARAWFYPGNYELLTAVFFLLAGHDGLWLLPDLIAWAVLFLGLWSLLSTCGLSAVAAPLYAGAAVLMPVVQRAVGLGDNDLFAAGLFVASLWLLLAARQRPESLSAVALALLVAAVLVGTKLAALPPAALLGLLAAAGSRGRPSRAGRLRLAGLGLLALLFAASFYLRNAIMTGNPLYPAGLAPLGVTLLPWGDTSHLVATLRAISPGELAASTIAGTSHPAETLRLLSRHLLALAAAMLLALVAGSVWMLLGRWWGPGNRAAPPASPGAIRVLLVAVAVTAAAFLVTPLALENLPSTANQLATGWSLRFALPGIVLAFALAVLMLPAGAGYFLPWVLVAASVLPGASLAARPLAGTLLIFALLFVLFRLRERLGRVPGRWKLLGVATGLLAGGLLLQSLLDVTSQARRQAAEAGYTYGGKSRVVEWVGANVPDGATLVSLTSLRAYPLVGHRFQRRVVSAGMSLPASAWMAAQEGSGADYFILSREAGDSRSPTFGQFPPEEAQFVALAGAAWTVVFDDGFARVYRRW